MFAQRIVATLRTPFRRGRRTRSQKVDPDKIGVDIVAEQVKKMLRDADQKLILMVRG